MPQQPRAKIIVGFFCLFWLSIALSILIFGWRETWFNFSLPSFFPPFADMRTVQSALDALAQDIDPYLVNATDPWQRVVNYPPIWLVIAKTLRFKNELHYLGFEIAMVLGYLTACFLLLKRYPSIWLLAILLSGSSLLAVERGNNDILIFSLLYAAALLPAISGTLILLVSIVLKLYPIFAVPFLSRNKLLMVFAILISVGYFVGVQAEIQKITAKMDLSPTLSYGLLNIVVWFAWHLKIPVGMGLILLTLLLGAGAVLLYLLPKRLAIQKVQDSTHESTLFVMGAGIFLGTFLTASNWDYRLLFLSLCVPYLVKLELTTFKTVILVSMIIATNQCYLEGKIDQLAINLCIAAKCIVFVSLAALFLLELVHRLAGRWVPKITAPSHR